MSSVKKGTFLLSGYGAPLSNALLAPLKKGSDGSPTARAQHCLQGCVDQQHRGTPRVDVETNRHADGQKTKD